MSAGQSLDPSLIHILEVVFKLPPDSLLHRALKGIMYSASEDFIIIEADDVTDTHAFKGDDRKVVKIPPAGTSLSKTFKQFVAHQQLQGILYGSNDWSSITQDWLNAFPISNAYNPTSIATSSAPPPATLSKPVSTSLVHDF